MPHIHDKYDFTTSVFIVYKDKVLLLKSNKYKIWLPVGGHVELDENPDQALQREIAEESGLKVKILNSKPDIKYPGSEFLFTPSFLGVHDATDTHKHIDLVYFAVAESDKVQLSAEHTDFKWFTQHDLGTEPDLRPTVIFQAKAALKAAAQKVL